MYLKARTEPRLGGSKLQNLHLPHFPLTLSDAAFTGTHPERRRIRGESKVSRQVGLPHNLRAPHSKPKMAPLYFWRPSQDSCHGDMMAIDVLLGVHGPGCRL
jgi:hypothetical protein